MGFNQTKRKIREYRKTDFWKYVLLFAAFFFIGSNIPDQPLESGTVLVEETGSEVKYLMEDLDEVSSIAESRYLPDQRTEPERIILIDVDTLGANHVGAYGYQRNTTPFLDRFARRNTVFKNAVAPASWTRASQMSVFTGTYTRTHGLYLLRNRAPDEFNTMAEAFRDSGYRTGAFTGGKGMKDGMGFEQGFQNYTDYEGSGYVNMEENLDRAFDYVNKTRDSPSFTFIHGYDMHDPYGSTPGAKRYSVAGYQTPVSKNRLFYDNGTAYIRGENGTEELDQQDIENLRRAYDQDLKNTDELLEDFVQRLRENDLYENSTLVVYSSHGENIANNIYRKPSSRSTAFGHVYLWPQTTQVPMIIKSPEMERGVEDRPVSIIDIGPTLYDIAGLDLDPKTRRQQEGESLLGYTNRDLGDPEFSETKHADNMAVNLGDYKFIKRSGREDVLYRYENLSFSEVDLNESNEELRENLTSRIQEWKNETPETYSEAVKPDYRSSLVKAFISVSGWKFFEQADEPLELDHLVIQSSDSFKVRDKETANVRSGAVTELDADNGAGRSLEVRLFNDRSEEFALDYIEEKRKEAESVYKGAEPYGFRSGAQGCEGEYSPEIDSYEQQDRVVIRFYEDSEGFGGACEEKAHRKVTVYIGYCSGSGTLFRIEDRMSDLENSNRLGIGCS